MSNKDEDSFVFFDRSWDDKTKQIYFINKKNLKYQIYISFLVFVILILFGERFSDILINISFLALLVALGSLFQFKKRYISFRDTEDSE